jgi:hypothetical protein
MQGDPEAVTLGGPLVFVGTLSEDDTVHIQRYQELLVLGRPVRRAVSFIVTLLAVAAIWWILAWVEFPWWSWLMVAWVVVSWIIVVMLLTPGRARAVRRHYRKHAADYLESRVSIGIDSMEIENLTLKSSFQWKVIGLVANAPEGLLFCSKANHVYFWLPERVLAAGRVRDQILSLAGKSGVAVRNLR